jgi:hypothetical protein
MALNIALLGDSVFDNGSYVSSREGVVHQIRKLLKVKEHVTLLAQDGARIKDVERQFNLIQPSHTHLVVSVGGNDALSLVGGLEASNFCLDSVTEARKNFAHDYYQMVEQLKMRNLLLSTIYYPVWSGLIQQHAATFLALFNDAIISIAATKGLPVLDLRWICNEQSDYANPIEPSAKGGLKIARQVYDVCCKHDFLSRKTAIYGATGKLYLTVPFEDGVLI